MKQIIICLLGFASCGSPVFSSIISDDFNGSTIDSSKWDISTPFSGSDVSASGGSAVFSYRGTLETKAGFSNDIEVDYQFRFLSGIDHFNVVLRSNLENFLGLPAEKKGVVISFSEDGQQASIQQFSDTTSILSVTSLALPLNTDFDVKITDIADKISLYVGGSSTPLLTADYAYRPGNQLALYNRELDGPGASVDFVRIADSPGIAAVPESEYTGFIAGGLMLACMAVSWKRKPALK